jgi:hypothetical protein
MRVPHWSGRAAAVIAAVLTVPALATVPTGPAYAAAHVEGYVWASQPLTPQYVAATGYEYSSAGQPIVITRSGVGDYLVRFRGLATPGGVAHASAYGTGNGDVCTVAWYRPRGADEFIRVRCFDGNGNPSDSRFVANVTDQQAAPGHFGYLYSHDPNPAGGSYVPDPQWSYDSAAQPIVVTRTAVGSYQVLLGALDKTFPGDYWNGYFRATAVGSAPVRCEVLDPRFFVPVSVPVRCYDPAGLAVDSRFTLTYAHGVNLLGSPTTHATASALPQPAANPVVGGWSNPGGPPTATRLGVGDYLVSFPGLAMPHGHAMVNAFGTPPQYCTVAAWFPSGGAEVVRVNCWDAAALNTPTDVWAFQVSFTR